MSSSNLSLLVVPAALALGPAATAAAPAGDIVFSPGPLCADSGHCHLGRWLPSEPALGPLFGASVALEGNEAAIGAPGADRVELWRRTGGQWQLHQLLDSPTGSGAEFGAALHLDGDRLWVGAPGDDLLGADAGAAFAYERAPDGLWQPFQALRSPAPITGGRFGRTVAADGLWFAAGEPGAGASGQVQVFSLSSGTYAPRDTLSEPGTGLFGRSLSLDGNLLAVGAPSDSTLAPNAGAVWVYGLGVAAIQPGQQVLASDGDAGDAFGVAVDLEDGQLLVGAQGVDDLAPLGGAAYLFELQIGVFPSSSWVELDKLLPCEAQPGAQFGAHVARDGNRLAIGAPGENGAFEPGGKAYVFRFQGIFVQSWQPEEQLRALDSEFGDAFGAVVALDGEQVLVGGPAHDAAGPDRGSALLFSLQPAIEGGGVCPCDTLATLESYGAGKPGTNGVPELSISRPLTPGAPALIGVESLLQGTAPVLLWGLVPAAIPFDGGILHMADPRLVNLPFVSSLEQVGIGLTLGTNPALCGVELIFQSMVLDPLAGGALGTAQSNAVSALIGY